MIPALLPHDRHARAVALRERYEREARERVGDRLAIMGVWKYPTPHVDHWLLALCHGSAAVSDSAFDQYVLSWLNGACSRYPLRIVEPAESVIAW